MKYPAKNPAKFLKPEPEPDIEAGYPAGSGFSRISGQFLAHTSQYLVLWTPSAYALANLLSDCRALMAAENCDIGWRVEGKFFIILVTWDGMSARAAHSADTAFTYRVGGVRWEGNVSMCRIVEITK